MNFSSEQLIFSYFSPFASASLLPFLSLFPLILACFKFALHFNVILMKKYPYRESNPNYRIESPVYYRYTIWIIIPFSVS